jgi:MIP family channel proteins
MQTTTEEPPFARQLGAEFTGTFLLTLIAAGTTVVAARTPGSLGVGTRAVAPALMIAAAIYALGDVSGAHFNPVVTVAFALRRDFRWSKVAPYWAAQLAGALTAAAVLRGWFGRIADVGSSHLDVTSAKGFTIEAVLTGMLVTVIINVANKHRLLGPDAARPVGATIASCHLFGLTLTGASMNPARSLGPAIVARHLDHVWIYLAGPAAGALAAVALSYVLHPRTTPDEANAAHGEDR